MYSENDMKEFFQNIVDQVATLSTQASRVEGLEQKVQALTERLNNLEQENYQLKVQLKEATDTVDQVKHEMAVTTGHLDNEKAVNQSLRDTIVQRDAGVVALENSFRQEQDAHKITTSERDDARKRSEELQSEVQRHIQHVNDLSTERDTWRSRASEAEREVNDLKSKLDRVQSILQPLRAISGDVQAVG